MNDDIDILFRDLIGRIPSRDPEDNDAIRKLFARAELSAAVGIPGFADKLANETSRIDKAFGQLSHGVSVSAAGPQAARGEGTRIEKTLTKRAGQREREEDFYLQYLSNRMAATGQSAGACLVAWKEEFPSHTPEIGRLMHKAARELDAAEEQICE